MNRLRKLVQQKPWWLIAALLIIVFLLPGRDWLFSAASAHTYIWHSGLHYFGIDNTSGPWYGFWSGFGSDLGEITLLGAVIAAYRHKNCHVKGCPRLGHIDPAVHAPACKRHHSHGHLHGIDPHSEEGASRRPQ